MRRLAITPGPWRFEGGCIVTDGAPHSDRATIIAQRISAQSAGTITAPRECEANGRAMAAVPQLLAELCAMLRDLREQRDTGLCSRHRDEQIAGIAAALRAAGVMP